MNNTLRSILALAAVLACSASNVHAQTTTNSILPRTTRLPEVTVSAQRAAEMDSIALREERPVLPTMQPEWTTHRRFPTTRVYVQKAPWEAGTETWWRGRFERNGKAVHQFQHELEVGLPYRMQFDLYETWRMNDHRRARHHDVATELRWAPADWGKIPLNPAFYGEWKFVDKSQGPDVYEVKLLLGEQIAPRWHWGFNAVFELEVGGGRGTELGLSQAISYTLIDEKLSIGAEMKFTHESEAGNRRNAEVRFGVGPSLQWRPTAWSHLDIVPLIGTTGDSRRVEAFVVFGIDFWPGEKIRRPSDPSSLKSN